jgi:hypothetical protein
MIDERNMKSGETSRIDVEISSNNGRQQYVKVMNYYHQLPELKQEALKL